MGRSPSSGLLKGNLWSWQQQEHSRTEHISIMVQVFSLSQHCQYSIALRLSEHDQLSLWVPTILVGVSTNGRSFINNSISLQMLDMVMSLLVGLWNLAWRIAWPSLLTNPKPYERVRVPVPYSNTYIWTCGSYIGSPPGIDNFFFPWKISV